MKFIFELSKEFKNLPTAEILSCLNSEDINYKIINSNEDLLIILTKKYNEIKQISKRLSLTYNVGELLFVSSNSIKELREKAFRYNNHDDGSIAVKYRNRSKNSDSNKIVENLAEILTKDMKVNLNNPDIEIRCLITDKKIFVSRNLYKINRANFEERKIQYRPFFSPISLHPKISRAIVNLSMVRKNEILLDPFCGTGGILIEAGILGVKIIGNDIDKKLVKGCIENLKYYDISNFQIYNLDIGQIKNKISKVNVIVSDFPYGKSTTTHGEEIISLYQRAFVNIYNILQEGGIAVIGLANKDMIKIGKKYLSLESVFDIRVHNSLTRYFVVYRKKEIK